MDNSLKTKRPTHLMAVAFLAVISNFYCLDQYLKYKYPDNNIMIPQQVIVEQPVFTYDFKLTQEYQHEYDLSEPDASLVEILHGDNPTITLNDPKPDEVENIDKKIKVLEPTKKKKIMMNKAVKVTFYDPFDPRQTDNTPGICRWDYKVKPGDKIIALSHDLVKNYGLTDGDIVDVGIWGKYVVRDTMNKRWRKMIDIAITNPKLTRKEKYKLAMDLGNDIVTTIKFKAVKI